MSDFNTAPTLEATVTNKGDREVQESNDEAVLDRLDLILAELKTISGLLMNLGA